MNTIEAMKQALGDFEDLHANHNTTCASSMAALSEAIAREEAQPMPAERAILGDGTESTKCPLCAQTCVHEHTPIEIICYRNGVKYGRSLGPNTRPLAATPEMIEAGAQRLVSWEDGCVWPESWGPLELSAARNEADRVWRSMWVVFAQQGEPE